MYVLHINQSDVIGGAALAGYRLHQNLLASGIDSRLLVGTVASSSDTIAATPNTQRIAKQFNRFAWRLGLNYVNILSTFDIHKHTFYQNADILNFHNIHNGYFNYLAIPSLTKEKPAILTLHDMWSFTGHCIYSYECERWKIGCGRCPYPGTYPAIGMDNTHLEWKLKNWVYSRSNLTIVTPSQWLSEQAKLSMLNRFPIHYIPNGIDTEAYQPLDREQCKFLLGIPSDKKVLLFGSEYINDYRKGADLSIEALQNLPESLKSKIVLLILGKHGEAFKKAVGLPSVNLGYVSSDRLKSIAYSAADLLIFATRADNLPLVLQESMACATPSVSFKVGGVPEIVRSGLTGYLAQPEDARDFGNGIVQLLEDDRLRESMGKNCREIILNEYSLELQAQRYEALYRKVLQN
jgi:glycosyltransferase involved in cell wall biosynthesis